MENYLNLTQLQDLTGGWPIGLDRPGRLFKYPRNFSDKFGRFFGRKFFIGHLAGHFLTSKPLIFPQFSHFSKNRPSKWALSAKNIVFYLVLWNDEGIYGYLKCKNFSKNCNKRVFGAFLHPNGTFEMLVKNQSPSKPRIAKKHWHRGRVVPGNCDRQSADRCGSLMWSPTRGDNNH